jgi:3-phosphoshikimate 1-carboxyvinyltransferase
LQGDRVYAELFEQLAKPRMAGEALPQIDLADCPDLAPVLFAVAAATGGACFTHTNRLRDKESDRIAAMQQELQKFGATIWEPSGYEDLGGAVCVEGSVLHPPVADLNGHNDHRVVMSLAVLATRYGGTICGADAVKKSLPDFFERLSLLGAKLVQEGAEESNATDER